MDGKTHLTWGNVGIGFGFIAFDAAVSKVLGVHVGGSLLTASIRCILQLSAMGLILQSVFDARNIWAAAGISLLLVCLGTFETIVNKSKLRFSHMVPVVFLAIFVSTIPVSVIGTRFAIGQKPFWVPDQYSACLLVLSAG